MNSDLDRGGPSTTKRKRTSNKNNTKRKSRRKTKEEIEPECDCSTWDSDCKVLPQKGTCSLLILRETDPMKTTPTLQPNLTQSNFVNNFKKHWSENAAFVEKNVVELITEPFNVCVIDNFLKDPGFFTDLRHEFDDIDWNFRSTDLYEFFQSKDLKHLTDFPVIQTIYELLKGDVMKWVANLTGYNLTHISATCSFYSNTDYLLVHDDLRGDRMVAFVLYFTDDDWDSDKGGALQLLTHDELSQPTTVVRDLFPATNKFVFFPVTNVSYHQVGEVTGASSCRFSINGWFHTKTPPTFQTPEFAPYSEGLYAQNRVLPCESNIELRDWISEQYLDCGVCSDVQQHFEEYSEISLHEFFREESFNEIYNILHNTDLKWVKVRPANRFGYEVVEKSDLPEVLDRFLTLFKSMQMYCLLKKYTDLDLTSMRFELQRWSKGSYALLSDLECDAEKELDLILHFGCETNQDVIGARTQYVSTEDEIQEALVTIEPLQNSLNLIYRDTARFTKYYSKQSKYSEFYTLHCTYIE